MSIQTTPATSTYTCNWRVSAVPELRSIFIEDRNRLAAGFHRLAREVPTNHPNPAAYATMMQGMSDELQFVRQVGNGEMFWVSADMVQLALDAAEDVPGWVPGADLPSTHGFMVLEKALPALRTWVASEQDGRLYRSECDLAVEAISWSTVDGLVKIDSHCRVETMDVPPTDEGTTFESVRYFLCEEGRPYDFSDESLPDDGLRLMSFLAAASILMSSPGVADTSTVTPKTKAARKAAKKGKPSAVTVVSLHAPAHVETGSKDSAGREYTHRWIVRGHWRQQAHGPNRAKRRTTWIPSYVKGPADKPLRETERVWAWRR